MSILLSPAQTEGEAGACLSALSAVCGKDPAVLGCVKKEFAEEYAIARFPSARTHMALGLAANAKCVTGRMHDARGRGFCS